MRFWIVFIWMTGDKVYAQNDAWMNDPNAFNELTPENLQQHVTSWQEVIANEPNSERKGQMSAFLVAAIASRGFNDEPSLDYIIDLANKTLTLDLSPHDRMNTYWHKATAIRRKNQLKTGEGMRLARREMATELLKGYKSGHEFCQEFKKKYPDFNPSSSPRPDSFKIDPFQDGPPQEFIEAQNNWGKLIRNYRLTETMEHEFKVMENDLIDVYKRSPNDIAELHDLAFEILGDSTIADRLTAQAEKERMAREKKKINHDIGDMEKDVINDLALKSKTESASTNLDPIVKNTKKTNIQPQKNQNPIAESSDRLYIWLIIAISVILVGIGFCVRIRSRRS
ncbi:hypothetical protein JXA32_00275 [Candidatus Sumerlaeota bacterium]|nr:hypothetical protein [Candidatus Sumerlaeota bacterium]